MKKTLLVMTVVLCLLSLFVSCKDEVLTATLRVEMDKGTRTIAPEQDEMEIYGYRVIPVGPDGKETAARYTYYSYINLDGLTVGDWTIKVYGFSKDRKDLAYGEQKVSLQTGKNTTTIEVKELIGEGSLEVNLLWDSEQLPTASRIKLVMFDQDNNAVELTASTPTGGKAVIKEDHLAAGSYRLQCELLDQDGKKLSGFAEAIRIANGTVTTAEIQFAVINQSSEEEVTLSDTTTTPIEVKINGTETLLEASREFTVNLSVLTQNVNSSDLNVEWYLDGSLAGKGVSWTFKEGVTAGTHRIDVVVSTPERGSIGSASVSFLAAQSTSPGTPYQRNTLTHGSTFKMGNNTVIRFLPDNRLVIASNATKVVQLVDISGTSPVLVNQFTYDELGLEGDVADFASYGEEDDTFFSVIFLCNSTGSCRIVNVICSRDQMTYSDMVKNPDSTGGSNPANQLVNIVPGDQIFVVTIQSTDKNRMGYIYLNMNPTYGNMINRKDWFLDSPRLEYGYSGFKEAFSLSSTGYTVLMSGQRAKVLKSTMQSSGKASVQEFMMWISWDDYMKYYDTGKTKAEFNDGKDCGFLTKDAQYAYIFSTEGIYYYKLDTMGFEQYQQYHKTPLTNRKIGDIRMTPDTEFGYMIDNDNHRLYSMNVRKDAAKGGYVLEEGDWIELPNANLNRIEICQTGNYLAIYNTVNTESVTVIKAAR